MLYILILILKFAFYMLLTLIISFLTIVIGYKLWFEPVKGVCTCTTQLSGKVALVTGGNTGIGLETARGLARLGARVIIASRDEKKSQEAVKDIIKTTRNTQVEYRHLNLAKCKSVRLFAEYFNDTEERLDLLVNNAGCLGAKACLTEDGIDLTTQVNHFGAFLLTNLLLEKLKKSKPSRIVVVTSMGHRFCTFDPDDIAGRNSHRLTCWEIYARSKLLQIFWTRALAKRLPRDVTINAVHPGFVKTEIFSRLPPLLQKLISAVQNALFKSSAEGAHTSLHVCVAHALQGATGGFYVDCRLRNARALVNDDALVERIWRESLALTKSG